MVLLALPSGKVIAVLMQKDVTSLVWFTHHTNSSENKKIKFLNLWKFWNEKLYLKHLRKYLDNRLF